MVVYSLAWVHPPDGRDAVVTMPQSTTVGTHRVVTNATSFAWNMHTFIVTNVLASLD